MDWMRLRKRLGRPLYSNWQREEHFAIHKPNMKTHDFHTTRRTFLKSAAAATVALAAGLRGRADNVAAPRGNIKLG